MSKTYAIADLHGRADLLLGAYDALSKCEPGLIVHLGDYIDRGKQSREVIEFLMSEETLPSGAWRRIILKGNHEQIMVETLRKKLDPSWWIGNGGALTLYSYGHPKIRGQGRGNIFPYRPDVVPMEHLDFLDGLPLYFCDKQRVYVHACLDPAASLPEQKEDVLLWGLYKESDIGGYRGAHVVHGHHQQDGKPLLLPGRTNLDAGAWDTGILMIGVFDDETPGGPVDLIGVKG